MMDDIDRIMDVMETAFEPRWGEAWNRAQLTSSLSLPTTSYRLLDEFGQPVNSTASAAGFILVRSVPGDDELLLIGVKPQYRGRGIGTRLLELLIADAQSRKAEKVFLEMRENNPAVNLYRTMGFTEIGRRRNYYKTIDDGRMDAITFALEIPK